MSWTDKQKVVVPVDLSDFSYSAVKVAGDFVSDNNKLHVIHVVRELNPNALSGYLGKEYIDNRPRVCQELLNQKIGSEFPGVHIHVEHGDPGIAIAGFATRIQADLIVMNSHGRRGMKQHMIGSVAERVLRLAKCPVLICKFEAE
ncbi:MAG: universal stress protein [Desulfohalobiaceae bacterium]|nr:universal stress protein [Desulfohalobiaceae bacterium]